MKKLSILLVLFIIICACNKDSSADVTPTIEEGKIIAKIDGETFSSSDGAIVLTSIVTHQLFTITGAITSNSTVTETLNITFTLPSSSEIEESTYQYMDNSCNASDSVCAVIAYGSDSIAAITTHFSTFGNGNAQIEFIDIDYKKGGTATGSFSATVFDEFGDEIKITDGQFNLKIE